MATPTVFISYSHDSVEHGDRVLALANRLVEDGIDVMLDQYVSSPLEGWPRWMDKHIRESNFVLMVCTETYFRRVMGEEKQGTGLGVKWEGDLICQHIYNADTTNTRFIPVLFDYCKFEYIPTPLQGATYYRIDTPDGYEDLYRRVTDQLRVRKPKLGKLKALPPRERKPDYLGVKISLAKLPSTSPDLFGREKELKALDESWGNPNINVVSLVAWGGVGKTALVNKWLLQMGKDNWRGAERVFGWSFYSQGAVEGRQVSADEFIAAALKWFGDPDPTQGSPWDKGERLAELVKRQRTLLILDGLEPLQNPPPIETGKIKDPGLCCLLRELARQNPGLAVITTRLEVDDLKDFVATSVQETHLDHLSLEAGAAYLTRLGVKGTVDELMQASKDFGGHALALTLLGGYLADVHDGDIRKRDLIPKLTVEEEKGGHARRVMEGYERWFVGKPEYDLLCLMGLFDRPAPKGAIDAVLVAPPIDGLTSRIRGSSPEEYRLVLKHLRQARLLAEPDPREPDTLDCHPLIREHFGEKLKAGNPDAWREAHRRLYEYYKRSAKELPDTIEEMAPLYAAVMHGCQAGNYLEALKEVYQRRIHRGGERFYAWKVLGAFGADLAALSAFFELAWHRPAGELSEEDKGTVLYEAGFHLRALGRLAEASEVMRAGLDGDIAREDWRRAATAADNLSEVCLTSGDLKHALIYAKQGVELADRGGEVFWQMGSRTILANVLFQVGRLREAEAAFNEGEEMQKQRQPEVPFLYSLRGFQYCDLLLEQGKHREVHKRASQTLELAERYLGKGLGLHDTANDCLSLGRAHLMEALSECRGDYSQSATYLERAVDGLRRAGRQDHLPRGLLARAELRRVRDELDKARHDLDEAFSICTRCGMRLYEADCHLEYARWHLASGDKPKAQESLAKAKKMIDEMGYHRRDKEVKDLEAQLGS